MSNKAFLDKICIVTGAASGIGLELARQLAASGACVVLGDVDAAGVAEAAAGILRTGGKAKAVAADVTDAAAVRGLVEGTAAEFGRIDYLFNNAGVAIIGEIRDLSLEQWRRVIEVNLFGEIHCIHYAYPIMIGQGFGHIVNIASGSGIAPGPLNTPYVASKFAIVGLSHALAAEARAFGVAVSVICPGYVDSPMMSEMQPVNAEAKDVNARIDFKRLSAERAAQIILARLPRKRVTIAFPFYVHAFAFLHRFAPGLFLRFSARQVDRFRRIRKVAG